MTNAVSDRFQVKAAAVGRGVECVEREASERQSVAPLLDAPRSYATRLPEIGTVTVVDKLARLIPCQRASVCLFDLDLRVAEVCHAGLH